MSAPYDETFEEFERRTGLNTYFGEYSTDIRGKLLSKNLDRPTDVYDVLYPNTKNDLLAKNVPIRHDLDRASKEVRDSLLARHVSNEISLEESGELQRKQNISKNRLLESATNLEDLGEKSRKDAIAKNAANKNTLDTISRAFRSSNVGKNVSNNSDLLKDSQFDRDNSISKNYVNDNDPYNKKGSLDDPSYRSENLSRNSNKNIDLEIDSQTIRREAESKNVSNESDLLSMSESNRKNSLSRNLSNENDLESDSKSYRQNSLSKNEPNFSDLDDVASSARPDNLSRNNPSDSDLDLDAIQHRGNSISKNTKSAPSLDEITPEIRSANLGKNDKSNSRGLEDSSKEFRSDSLSKNNQKTTDLESESSLYRDDSISKNKTNNVSLEDFSDGYRSDSISKNKITPTDLEEISGKFRNDDLKNNNPKNTDLENDSTRYRQDDLSYNTPKNSNLESDSVGYRQDDLSFNRPILSDLESQSVVYRDGDLANNIPIESDLESDSEQFRQDDLSFNVASESDLEFDSVQYRNDDLSANLNISSDLEQDSIPFRNDDLSSNVNINSDLEQDSIPYLGQNLSHNVPNSSNLEVDSQPYRAQDLAHNITGDFDLEAESILFRNGNINSNVENITDLLDLSQQERAQQISANGSEPTDLNNLSSIFRNEQLSKNDSRFSLGTNVILAGTSQFIGVSNLEIQGAIFRTANKVLNSGNKGLDDVFDDDQSIKFFEETALNATIPGGREVLMQKNSPESLAQIEGSGNIIQVYGTKLIDDTSGIDDGLRTFTKPQSVGFITNLISLHNIQQNTFQSRPGFLYDQGKQNAIEDLRNFGSPGFQELISKTGIQKRLQVRTNTTPEFIINENNGNYLSQSAEKILKTSQEDESLGTGVSMASQTDTTDSIQFDFDKSGPRSRGVRHVIDTIKEDERISFAQNFRVQGNKGESSVFILGKKTDGTYKKNYNRWTIKNPYAPEGALGLDFYFENYSNGQKMVFPAYIKSFQHGDSANWNSTNFLGRPEAVYTYNNSSRDGSISFFVLTDFAERVDMGYYFNEETGEVYKLQEDFTTSFTKVSTSLRRALKDIDAQLRVIDDQIESDETSEEEKSALRLERDSLINQKSNIEGTKGNSNDNFNENAAGGATNLYSFIEGFQENQIEGDYVETKAENTLEKISQMKQGVLFQPSYFSGSKADFLERMEFLQKMTRPARNNNSGGLQTGFSFTKAPVCHVHLGDWFNHDIIVNSVAYNYDGAPWTMDGGKVYPMWCEVTVNFNIIGTFRARSGDDAPLSTDRGGFMGSDRRSI